MNPIIKEDARVMANAELPWEELYNKTVLISGANGYVPAYFVHAFMARNDLNESNIRVIALCRNEERAKKRFDGYLCRNDFTLIIQYVCDPINIDEDIHYFIHAASPAGLRIGNIDPLATFDANVTGCKNMLELCAKKNTKKFLFLSSIDAYGKIIPSKRFTETDCGVLDSMDPRNVYAIAKHASENLCVCHMAKHRTPVVVVRPSQIIGPGVALDDGRLHADFISQMLRGGKIILKSDGSAKRTFLYITDAVTGMLAVMLKGVPGEAYNVADENGEATVLELANLMASLARGEKIEVAFDYNKRDSPEVTHALSEVTGDSNKLRSLGWRSRMTLKDGAERTMRYYGL